MRLEHLDGTHLIDCLIRTSHPCPLRPGAFPRRPLSFLRRRLGQFLLFTNVRPQPFELGFCPGCTRARQRRCRRRLHFRKGLLLLLLWCALRYNIWHHRLLLLGPPLLSGSTLLLGAANGCGYFARRGFLLRSLDFDGRALAPLPVVIEPLLHAHLPAVHMFQPPLIISPVAHKLNDITITVAHKSIQTTY